MAYEAEIFMEKLLPTKQLYWLHTRMFFPLPKYSSDLPTTEEDLADTL